MSSANETILRVDLNKLKKNFNYLKKKLLENHSHKHRNAQTEEPRV